MNLKQFESGSIELRKVCRELYSAVIKDKLGDVLARFVIRDSLYEVWQEFSVEKEIFDLNLYTFIDRGKLSELRACVYPVVKNGNFNVTDTSVFETLRVVEV